MNSEPQEKELPLGLYWKGKNTTVDRIVLPFQSLEVIETINESRATREKEKDTMFRQDPNAKDVEWRNKLIWGDNKYVMSALLQQYAGKIDLIYIDPPFATVQILALQSLLEITKLNTQKKQVLLKS
jgi:16S rRNA G966 N2-methylase RsmD